MKIFSALSFVFVVTLFLFISAALQCENRDGQIRQQRKADKEGYTKPPCMPDLNEHEERDKKGKKVCHGPRSGAGEIYLPKEPK